jgi:3-methyladenine DNA glycosylase Mpg
MTDSKGQKTTLTLEPGQIAIVLGLENGQVSRQLFASPEIDAMLDDDQSDIPLLSRIDIPATLGSG